MSNRPIDNERKACDAIAQSLEALVAAKRSNPRLPERDGEGALVDYVFDLSGKTYALEHTIIEAFPRQIQTGNDFGALVKPIQDALDHCMPLPASYHLTFPLDPCAGLKPREIAKAQDAIIAWVKATAAELHSECPEPPIHRSKSHTAFRKQRIQEFNFEVRLTRTVRSGMSKIAKGRLFVQRYAPNNCEDLRQERIQITLDKKLPKLASWKARGATSVLVLENTDIALTNEGVVADALESNLDGRADKPDEIWLVDTTDEDEWTVLRLMLADEWFPDREKPDRYRHFKVSDLAELEAD
jgi:hypothetical protein